jgi:hypothetical protein
MRRRQRKRYRRKAFPANGSMCKRHAIDPRRYLTQLFVNLPAAPITRLCDWLPDQWKLRNSSPSG